MKAAVGGEEEELKQAKEMAAARRRWETLVLYFFPLPFEIISYFSFGNLTFHSTLQLSILVD